MPLSEVIYAMPRRLTVSGLTAADMLIATCIHCYKTNTYAPWELHLHHRPEMTIDKLLPNLACPKCKELGARDWRVKRAHFGGCS